MRKKLRISAWILGTILLSAGLLLWVAYRATQSVPAFYREATAPDRATQQRSADEMGTRATVLYGDVRKLGEWHALFTDQQINSWLAVELIDKHPDLLPEEIQDPRIAITPGRLTVGFRAVRRKRSTVISVELGVYLTQPDVVACRFYRAHLGRMRLSLQRVLEEVTQLADQNNFPIRWGQAGGDPVVLINISAIRNADDPALQIDKIELLEGELYLAGHTQAEDLTPENTDLTPEKTDQTSENTKDQR